jgi:hypothetical protein
MVTEIDDVADALRVDISQHRFERQGISMDVGNGGEFQS